MSDKLICVVLQNFGNILYLVLTSYVNKDASSTATYHIVVVI